MENAILRELLFTSDNPALAALVDRPTAAPTPATPPRATSDPLTGLPSDPRARLWSLLTTWSGANDETLTHEQADAMRGEINRLMSHPAAEAWLAAWRLAHPDVKRNFNVV